MPSIGVVAPTPISRTVRVGLEGQPKDGGRLLARIKIGRDVTELGALFPKPDPFGQVPLSA